MKRLLVLSVLVLAGVAACGNGTEVCRAGETFCTEAPTSTPCDANHAKSVQTETKSDGSTVTTVTCQR